MRFRFGTEDDIDALADLVGRCFDDGAGVDLVGLQKLAYRAIPAMSPTWCWLGETDDGRIVARWQIFLVDMTVRGAVLPVWGALGVAIDRDHRRPGVVEGMIRAGREASRERGMLMHVGFVEEGAIWGYFGGEPIQPRYHATFDAVRISDRRVVDLESLPSDPMDLLASAASATILDRHNRAVATRTGGLYRDPVAWPFARHRARHLFVGPGMHLGYDVGDSVHVVEAEVDHPDGWRTLLATAAAHARTRGLPLTADLPPDHGFVATARPFGVEVSIRWPRRSQAMGGIDDVQGVFDRLAPVLPAGSFTWVVSGPEGATWTLGCGGPEVHAACTSGVVLQILVGYSSASAQRIAGRLVADDRAVALLDAVLPALHPFTCASDRF